ncbi:hypothetical protein V7S43_011480 [Phytophthora oleae]|uniref:Uncharacterized protein n=1 Tax=Phytophthora oleae TaxID=2107226 RepID=A0ABD3FA05_9STRA
MSRILVELHSAHGFVPLLVVILVFVNVWAGLKVIMARKLYGVKYPQMYAEQSDKNAKAFNCVQRGHQNIMENIPIFLALAFTSSIYRPLISAIASFVRILGFVAYMRGYSTGDPKKRLQGDFGYLGLIVNVILTVEACLLMFGLL